MKNTLSILLTMVMLASMTQFSIAQDATKSAVKPPHRIIFQLVSGDTLAHKQLMKQIANIQKVAQGTEMEVVCHGPGLDMLVAGKSTVEEKIAAHVKSGVVFKACEFSMKERNVEISSIMKTVGTVPAGIIEIVTKQEQGWSYIKAGF